MLIGISSKHSFCALRSVPGVQLVLGHRITPIDILHGSRGCRYGSTDFDHVTWSTVDLLWYLIHSTHISWRRKYLVRIQLRCNGSDTILNLQFIPTDYGGCEHDKGASFKVPCYMDTMALVSTVN